MTATTGMSSRANMGATASASGMAHPSQIEEIVDDAAAPLENAVSVIIPAYKEVAHVASQVESVRRVMEQLEWPFEIIDPIPVRRIIN